MVLGGPPHAPWHSRHHSGPIKCLVVGGGVAGLTTSLILREKGLDVVCVAENFEGLTSHGAGALWEANPYGCGMEPAQAYRWACESYRRFSSLMHAQDRGEVEGKPGISERKVVYLLRHPSHHDTLDVEKRMKGYEEGQVVIDRYAPHIRNKEAYTHAYCYDALMINMKQYMPWLHSRCKAMGVKFVQMRLPLIEDAKEYAVSITPKGGSCMIFNCTGLAAAWFLRASACSPPADTQLYPRFGQYFLLQTDEITDAITDEYSDKGALAYLLPRGDGTVVAGGTSIPIPLSQLAGFDVQPKEELRKRVWRTCTEAVPAVKRARVVKEWAGLRPFREGGARCEVEKEEEREGRYLVVGHNYGHGGSGITLSFGSALSIVEKAINVVAEKELKVLKTKREETKQKKKPVPLRSRL